ncbi:response regulator [bacterium]|nr:response regulator [bacterium]
MTAIRVVLVEDSVTQREVLRRVMEEDGDIQVVAEGRNGREGLEKTLALQPDVVVTDVWMPELNGLRMIRAILKEVGVPIIVVSATLQKNQIDLAFECLEAGAVTAIEKPDGATLIHLKKMGGELRRTIRAYSTMKILRRRLPAPGSVREASAPPPRLPSSPAVPGQVDVVGMVASTGGPPVLTEILSALPADYSIPILVVQHISAGFEEGFVNWLSQKTALPVSLVANGTSIGPGIFFGPNGRHLTLGRKGRISLEPPDPRDLHVPSGNRLLSSLAESCGNRAAGVVLTGMGDDGAEGLKLMFQKGARTAAQDEASSLIWGMPGEAVKRGAAQMRMDPAQIAAWLGSLAAQAMPKS